MRLLSFTSSKWVVNVFENVAKELVQQNVTVSHYGLDTDNWYGGNARPSFESTCHVTGSIPRVEGTRPWWHEPQIDRQYRDSYPQIEIFLDKIYRDYQPTCILCADDTGPLEVQVLKKFYRYRVPIVLWEHGFGFAFAKLSSNNRRASIVSIAINRVFQSLRPSSWRNCPSIARGFGENVPCEIACLGTGTREIHRSYGIPTSRLHVVGSPYFDSFIAEEPKDVRQDASSDNSSVLITSTGHGLFGHLQMAETFYTFGIDVTKKLQGHLSVLFRCKPGEDPSIFLTPETWERAKNILNFTDNQESIRVAILSAKLLVCEPSSAVLEAVMLQRPVVILETKERKPTRFDEMLIHELGVMTVRSAAQLADCLPILLGSDYLSTLQTNLQIVADHWLGGLDGMSASRIATLISRVSC